MMDEAVTIFQHTNLRRPSPISCLIPLDHFSNIKHVDAIGKYIFSYLAYRQSNRTP